MKNIIITGASKGIGYATALSLASKGHNVLAIARNEDLLDRLVSESGDKISTIAADISAIEGRAIISSEVQKMGSVDILINNAGILIKKSFLELTADDWKTQFDVNLFGIVELIKLTLPLLNSGSQILNIGSMGGFQGSKKFKGLSAYGATKAALANLTETLAVELSDRGIHVNCLSLGAVSTDMQKNAFPGLKPEISSTRMGEFIANFAVNDGFLFNGKVIPVALNNPS